MTAEKRDRVIRKVEEVLKKMKEQGHLYSEVLVRDKAIRILEGYSAQDRSSPLTLALAILHLAYHDLKHEVYRTKAECLLKCGEGGKYHDVGTLAYFSDYFGISTVAIRNSCRKLRSQSS